jgi:5-methyltetrahydropteroyltriglutamate--homocysteine methyltransferase
MMKLKTTRFENGENGWIFGGMQRSFFTHNLGFPRIGAQRELKKAVESFWQGRSSEAELLEAGRALRKTHWQKQKDAGIDLIPSNDFSFYDQMLDLTCLLGNIPPRFREEDGSVSLETYFALARGRESSCGCGSACEMTKWFDTNYHYIVPEFDHETTFSLTGDKPFAEFLEAKQSGIHTKPVLIGPLTYLYLGKSTEEGFDRLTLLDRVLPVYGEILRRLSELGVTWVQIDEPILALDLDDVWRGAFANTYRTLRASAPELRLLLATYFGELRENLSVAADLPIDTLHIDLTRSGDELDAVLQRLPATVSLSLGVVDGRNIWRNDFENSLVQITRAQRVLSPERLWIAPSCSLLHVPVSLRHEATLDEEIKGWLAFAEEKLREIRTLADLAAGRGDAVAAYKNRVAVHSRRASTRTYRADVRARVAAIQPADSQRISPFAERARRQQAVLGLPNFPTTTIGSFPQTADIRQARARWKHGELSDADYETFLQTKTADCVRLQEEIGLDVLVHGEFERNDMVEYFGEQLEGFVFTASGWVQSYGSRCVKPPIIFGDIHRPSPMTVGWSSYAQSLTKRPMKGMLTGPITILQWSFVRDDIPRADTARQIALAIRDEVSDLEAAGLQVIQIDEPALREGLPLRRRDWRAYLEWAGEAFRLSASAVRDETQIHTHMCYCEFNDIIAAIAALDADVISIETSRSQMELLGAFVDFQYPNGIGPGVWDIHSTRVPSTDEMFQLIEKAVTVLPAENLWVNPDCGLKTRGWKETEEALRHLVEAARRLRELLDEKLSVKRA